MTNTFASKPTVLVGMSGGVDSSVSAALLLEAGYQVIGGFIKNWSDSRDGWTGECAWRAERRDAMRVAAQLGIPLLTFDFEEHYRAKVVEELYAGYARGETPNPDVLCNEAIKFGLFFEEAKRLGIPWIATGHYARVTRDEAGTAHLLRGTDPDKDQSYFLYRISPEALAHTLFPIGHLTKKEVRAVAAEKGIVVAAKPDSQGICFIGKLDMVDFLRTRIPPKPGEIVLTTGEVVGRHEGLDGYTIGQRQRIGVSREGHAWYVARKEVETNRLVVVPSADDPALFTRHAVLADLHWTQGIPPVMPCSCVIQARYRQPPTPAIIRPGVVPSTVSLECLEPLWALAPGQSAVLYVGDECVGGGVIQQSLPHS